MQRERRVSDQPDLLSLLKALQPNSLYLITSKPVLLKGFQYYKEERLKSFTWQNQQMLLTAVVLGAEPYTVSFSSQKGTLTYSCTCPAWNTDIQCKHVICGLVTILNLISSKLFHQADQNENRLQSLKAVLLRNQVISKQPLAKRLNVSSKPLASSVFLAEEEEERFGALELVIESKGDYPAVFLRRGGTVVDSPFGLPEGLSAFTYRYYSDQSLRDRFFEHLTRFGDQYSMVLESNRGRIPLSWSPKKFYKSKTELDAGASHVEVHALTILDDVICRNVERFWDFAVDPETGQFGRVTDTSGWRLFDTLDHLLRPSAPSYSYFDEPQDRQLSDREWIIQNIHFKVPLATFQSIQFNISKDSLDQTLKDLVLKVHGTPVQPCESEHHYRLTIDQQNEETTRLKMECCLGEIQGQPTAHTFRFFTDVQDRTFPTALKALKRLTILYQTFFRLFSPKEGMDTTQMIRKALSNGDFTQYALKKEARDLLKRYDLIIKGQDVRLHFSEKKWFIVPNNKEKEAQLYQIPFELFGPKIFKDITVYHEVTLPAKQLYAQISLLHAKCEAAGIKLFHKGKPVKTVKWDFSFDARRRPGIDWFEIRPEIRSDGVIVNESVLQKLLEHKGVVEENGVIQIVDSNAQKIINALSLIYKSPNKDKKGKREIVEIPRMQILDWVSLRREGVQFKLPEEDEHLIKSLTQLEKIDAITTPRNLKAKLRPYQKEGLNWLAFLYQHRFGAVLADDMGLGKTLQSISLLAAIEEKIIPPLIRSDQPHLIVVPPTLLFNWEQELKRFYPKLRVYSYFGKNRNHAFDGMDVVLTTYALVRRDIDILKPFRFHVIIFDEAQAVKNVYADTTGAARQLQGAFKLVMTGTPLENHLGEYYSLIDLALPGLLEDYDRFKSQIRLEDSPLLQVLIARTRPFVLRRMKESVLKDLPPKIETDLYLDLTDKQKSLYQQTVAMISSQINTAYRDKTSGQAKIIALTAIMKLRQLCVSPRLIASDLKTGKEHSPKISFLVQQLQALHEEGHSALVFSQFTSGLDLLESDLQTAKLPFFRLDGSTPAGKRKNLVKSFQDSDMPLVFLLSLKAGGQGLNLTKASYVFHLDPWWNPAVENQASDRAHRIGQTQNVSITRILMRHTIEEKIMLLKKKKRALYEAVMGGAEQAGPAYSLTKLDFDFLLSESDLTT